MIFLHISSVPCLIGMHMLLVLIPFVFGHRKNKRLQAQFTVSCHDAYVGGDSESSPAHAWAWDHGVFVSHA